MSRFELLLVTGLLLVALAGLGFHWLWRQRGSLATTSIEVVGRYDHTGVALQAPRQ
jgi:hypothetical protein